MSETSEQQVTTRETRRCEKAAHEVMRSSLNQQLNESVLQMTIASTIDRLAADVAAIKEAVCDGSVAAAISERDAARAEVEKLKESRDVAKRLFGAEQAKVERLRKELEQRQPAGNSPKTSESSPAAPQPAAPPAGWLTERERHVLSLLLSERPRDWSLHWTDDVQPVFRSILSRAGSLPVVEVPMISRRDVLMQNEAFAYRDAMDKAGVPWKEVGRE